MAARSVMGAQIAAGISRVCDEPHSTPSHRAGIAPSARLLGVSTPTASAAASG